MTQESSSGFKIGPVVESSKSVNAYDLKINDDETIEVIKEEEKKKTIEVSKKESSNDNEMKIGPLVESNAPINNTTNLEIQQLLHDMDNIMTPTSLISLQSELQRLAKECDINFDSKLDMNEFETFIEKLFPDISTEDSIKLFKKLDIENKNEIDYNHLFETNQFTLSDLIF